MSQPPNDKRDRERMEILGDLRAEVMLFQPLSIKEISAGGCLTETAFPLHLDSLHDVRLTLGTRSIVVKGRVVHCSITDVDQETVLYRTGFEFVELSDQAASAIQEFIVTIRSGRGTL